MRTGSTYRYRPALDGVRALAVAAVVLFHGGVPGFGGGFLGVDTFFVLSGFLITSLLLAEHRATGRIALGGFWLRRVRRLVPGLLVMLAVVCVAARWVLPDVERSLLRGDALAAIGYVANWRMLYRGNGYFAATAAPSLLQHTWSLGIEEQFYLLWPLIVVVVLRRLGTRWLLALCTVGAVASAVAAWLLYRPDDVDRAYFGTDARAQALLIGSALAIVMAGPETARARAAVTTVDGLPGMAASDVDGAVATRTTTVDRSAGTQASQVDGAVRPGRGRHAAPARTPAILALVGAAVTLWCWTHASGTDAWLYHGGFTVVAVATAAVLAHAVRSGSRLLESPPLVRLGRISYGVYLWHWPTFQLLSADLTGLSGAALLALRCGTTLAVSAVSYVAVEMPVRRGGVLPLRLMPVGVGACVAVALAATTTHAAATPPPVVAAPAPSMSPRVPPGGTSAPPRLPGPPRVEILGDSVAWTVGDYLPPHPGVDVYNHATQGCGITLDSPVVAMGNTQRLYPYCPSWPSKWQGVVNADHPDVVAILLNRWELLDAIVDGQHEHIGEPVFDAYLRGQLDEAVRIAGSGGARVVLLTAAYTRRAEKPGGGLYPEDEPSRVDAWNALLREEAAAHPQTVDVVDLGHLVCPQGTFTWSVDGVRIRSDGLHFTPAGVQRVIAPWLLPRLVAVAAGQ